MYYTVYCKYLLNNSSAEVSSSFLLHWWSRTRSRNDKPVNYVTEKNCYCKQRLLCGAALHQSWTSEDFPPFHNNHRRCSVKTHIDQALIWMILWGTCPPQCLWLCPCLSSTTVAQSKAGCVSLMWGLRSVKFLMANVFWQREQSKQVLPVKDEKERVKENLFWRECLFILIFLLFSFVFFLCFCAVFSDQAPMFTLHLLGLSVMVNNIYRINIFINFWSV